MPLHGQVSSLKHHCSTSLPADKTNVYRKNNTNSRQIEIEWQYAAIKIKAFKLGIQKKP